MAHPAPSHGPSEPEPLAVRGSLSPELAAIFDREWDIVLDQVKRSHDLADVHVLLAKWRHLAHAELSSPGTYFRTQAKAEEIARARTNSTAASIEEMHALIDRRLGR